MPRLSAGELAERFGLRLQGDADTRVDGVATLSAAGPAELAFLANPRYRAQLSGSRAGIVVLSADDAAARDGTALVARDPYAAFARIAALFEPREALDAGIHPTAVVDPSARIDPSASIGPLACIGARSTVAAGAVVGPGCMIGEDCEVGAGCTLVARVTLVRRVRLGARCLIHPGAVLGADGFGIAFDEGHWTKVPQLGGVLLGEDCEVGANTTIDRGALEDTVLEADVRIDNLVQVGHGVRIGAHTAIAGTAAIAGSARIGRHCLIGGGAGIVGHIEVCDRVTITARTLVTHDIRQPGTYSSGTPMMDNRSWRKAAARFRQLDDIARRKGDKD